MNKRLLTICSVLLLAIAAFASNRQERPKLVVGIVVDQMRWDYLYRYYDRFGEDGFKRLMNNGFNCENVMLNYIPTVTAIGHTSIYTGSVPSIHGIAGNDFYLNGKKAYCTADSTVSTVGSDSKNGKMSPHNLLATTIGDELKLATNFRSKVIGISIKDRAAILPAGHAADAAYWFDPTNGHFITSTYYNDKLPEWVEEFNDRNLPEKYLKQDWNTLYPIETYTASSADNNDFEQPFSGNDAPTMPVRTSKLYKTKGYGLISNTPYGNSLMFDLAEAAIKGEKLGQRNETDFLAISLSSTDYVGHQFGTYAVETEDTYLRLDRDLAKFLNLLDATVGKDNYMIFLTADHAAAHNFTFLKAHKIPAGGWETENVAAELNKRLSATFGTDEKPVKDVLNYQVFLDEDAIKRAKLSRKDVIQTIIGQLLENEAVAYAVEMEKAAVAAVPEKVKQRIINGYNNKRSGDIQIIMQPNWYEIYNHSIKKNTQGTTHGVWHPYDSHIPLIFMGSNIPTGKTHQQVNITDIAATVCAILQIQMPNGCIGNPIEAIMD